MVRPSTAELKEVKAGRLRPPDVTGRTQDKPKGEALLYFPKALGGWLRIITPFQQAEKIETQKGHVIGLKKQPKAQLELGSRCPGSSPSGLCPSL